MAQIPIPSVALGGVAPGDLIDARLQAHHAAQLVSRVGRTYLAPTPDDSHPNLGWSVTAEALASRAIPGTNGLHAGVRLRDLHLLVGDDDRGIAETFDLRGSRLREGEAWLSEALDRNGAQPSGLHLEPSPYDLPAHPVASDAVFDSGDVAGFAELGHWFAMSHSALEDLSSRTPGASDVRCWPHHFDIAILIAVRADAEGTATRTVGVGMTPGDGAYAEPYWYVNVWPSPDGAALPPLAGGGRWHQEGWTGAVLRGDALVAAGSAEAQARRLDEFLGSAVAAGRTLHGL